MATATHLSLEEFHRLYDGVKPNYEYWFGEAIQKPMATNLHGVLQFCHYDVSERPWLGRSKGKPGTRFGPGTQVLHLSKSKSATLTGPSRHRAVPPVAASGRESYRRHLKGFDVVIGTAHLVRPARQVFATESNRGNGHDQERQSEAK
jgi:hypothetical protein